MVKYVLALFIFLLIEQGHLFVLHTNGSAVESPARKIQTSTLCQAILIKTTEKETLYIEEDKEEDDERISFKKYLEGHSTFFALVHRNIYSKALRAAHLFLAFAGRYRFLGLPILFSAYSDYDFDIRQSLIV